MLYNDFYNLFRNIIVCFIIHLYYMFSIVRKSLHKNSLVYPVKFFSKGLFAFSNIHEPHDCILFANVIVM